MTTATLPARPRLKGSVEVFFASDGTLYLLRPGGDADLVIRDAGAAERALFQNLGGEATLAELPAKLRAAGAPWSDEETTETIEQLVGLGLVEDAESDARAGLGAEELARYDRQLAYFSELVAPGESRALLQARLEQARVVVLGLGGLGSWAAYALACAGVGRIDGIDGDVIELSNLNRQILYARADVGRPKAQVAAEAIRRFNPSIEFNPIQRRLESQADVEAHIAGADFLVEMADWPVDKIGHWCNAACFRLGVPYIAASQFPPMVRIGPTYQPGVTGCLECQETVHRSEFPFFDELLAARARSTEEAATFGPACGLIGSLVATDVVHHLTGICEPATLGTALLVDIRRMEVTRETVPRSPGCPVCG